MTRLDQPENPPLRAAGRAWHSTAVELSHLLVVPQGFTVAVAGSVAVGVGRHGFAGPFGVWLFVVEAGVAYCLVVLMVGALHRRVEQPGGIVGGALLNVTPVLVVPIVTLATWWLPDAKLAYFV